MNLFSTSNRYLSRQLTPAVKAIFLINCAVFIGIQVAFNIRREDSYGVEAFINFALAEDPGVSLPRFHLWQFFTYMFTHEAPLHFFVNMVILWFLAPELEYRWGTGRFWNFYLFVGVLAGIFHAMVALTSGYRMPPMIGASAALFGVMFAFGVYYPERVAYVFGMVPVRMKYLIPAFMAVEFVLLFGGAAGLLKQHPVSNIPHLSGLGWAYLYLSLYHRNYNLTRWRFLG